MEIISGQVKAMSGAEEKTGNTPVAESFYTPVAEATYIPAGAPENSAEAYQAKVVTIEAKNSDSSSNDDLKVDVKKFGTPSTASGSIFQVNLS